MRIRISFLPKKLLKREPNEAPIFDHCRSHQFRTVVKGRKGREKERENIQLLAKKKNF